MKLVLPAISAKPPTQMYDAESAHDAESDLPPLFWTILHSLRGPSGVKLRKTVYHGMLQISEASNQRYKRGQYLMPTSIVSDQLMKCTKMLGTSLPYC